jgi:predicted nucleic acid-binding protein
MAYLVDVDVLYAYMDSSDWLHTSATKFFEKAKNYELKTSAVAVLELAVVVKRELPDKLFNILDVLRELNIEILSVNEEITKTAFEFMKRGFDIFDAFHASTAKYYNLIIVSTDHKYKDVGLQTLDPRTTFF